MKENPKIHTQGDLNFGAGTPPRQSDSAPFVDVSDRKPIATAPKKKSHRPGGLCPRCHGSLIDNKCPDCDMPGTR